MVGATFDARSNSDAATPPKAPPKLKVPVVMAVFDEFPSDDLRLPDGRIDAARFPNFAKLAGDSTWYQNSRAVHDETPHAMPAILDGKRPHKEARGGTFRGHPKSIFGLLGDNGWKVVSSEEATDVCGERYCPGNAKRRMGILQNLAKGRPQRWDAWAAKIRRGEPVTFHFKHALLPHLPWIYLPTGQETILSMDHLASPKGFGDADLIRHNHARHLLQVGYTDHLLGKLIGRLKRAGLYDRAMIVVAADHGVAFDVGVKDQRTVTRRNIDEVAPTPFFIKAPGQRDGRANPAFVSNLDVVPTMAKILNLKIDWKIDGRPAADPKYVSPPTISMPKRNFDGSVSIKTSDWLARRASNRRDHARTFGTGANSAVLTGSPWGLVYGAGPHRELFGRRSSGIRRGPVARGLRGLILRPGLWRSVNPRARLVPTQVAGIVRAGSSRSKRNLAVAVNGRIEAVGRSFHLRGDSRELFSLIVPPSSLRRGRNHIAVYVVAGSGKSLRLQLMAGA